MLSWNMLPLISKEWLLVLNECEKAKMKLGELETCLKKNKIVNTYSKNIVGKSYTRN